MATSLLLIGSETVIHWNMGTEVYNPDFNYGEFAIIKSKAGLNNFKISAK
jgi:hypothetical protein